MKRITLSIGVPAYNEEANILNLLKSIFKQNQSNYKLINVFVVSDGSTDKTITLLSSFRNKKLKVLNYKKRKGQSYRLNEIIGSVYTDYLLFIDADMILKDNNSLSKLIAATNNGSADLITGTTTPLKGESLLEKAVSNYRFAREKIQDRFNWGNTAFAATAYLMLSKKMYKKFLFPKNILNHDAYCYFFAKTHKFKHVHSLDSVAIYRSAGRINEVLNQFTRHRVGATQLKEIFGHEIVSKEFSTPKWVQEELFKFQIFKNPTAYLFLKLIHITSIILSYFQGKNYNVKWNSVTSAKSLSPN